MFSGIVEEVGTLAFVVDEAGGRRLRITAPLVTVDAKLGDSIACSGACLTITELGSGWFETAATFETLRRTKLGALKQGSTINLERALRLADRLGGHIVSGHVDSLGSVTSIKTEGFSKVIEFSVAGELAPFFVEKGSVTIDGVSLTVASLHAGGSVGKNAQRNAGKKVSGGGNFKFTVAFIPHTLAVTTLGQLKVGDSVNIEADLIGKYVARLVGMGYASEVKKGGVTLPLLQEQGYT